MKNKLKLICCRALYHILEPMIDARIEYSILPIRLHLNQNNLRSALQEEIDKKEAPGVDILLGYGLCGRGVEGVSSKKSRLILPKVDDCIGALLGSRKRHQTILSKNAGTFFLEPAWLGTEVDIFHQSLKGLEKIPEEYRQEIVDMALKHYTQLVLIHHGQDESSSVSDQCSSLAKEHGLEFVQIRSDLTLLENFANGNITSDQFIIVEPGQKIPYF